MKNYVKPEIKINIYNINEEIANSISYNGVLNHFDNYDNDAGSINWSDLFN